MYYMEIYKDIKDYEGLYQISNLGNVKSLKGKKEKILKPYLSGTKNKQYLAVKLYKNNKAKNYMMHKLVAIAFLNHIPNGHKVVVDHLDNNKLNNTLSNLRLVTNRENLSKDKRGSSRYTGVSWAHRNKKWVCKIYINGKNKHIGYFDCELSASIEYQKALTNHLKTL